MGAFYYSISRSTCFSGRVLFAPVYLEFQSPNLSTFKEPRNRFRKPGPDRLHRLAESISWNRFLGFLQVYKFGSGSKTMISNILDRIKDDLLRMVIQTHAREKWYLGRNPGTVEGYM
jgi:hypothetical protein